MYSPEGSIGKEANKVKEKRLYETKRKEEKVSLSLRIILFGAGLASLGTKTFRQLLSVREGDFFILTG